MIKVNGMKWGEMRSCVTSNLLGLWLSVKFFKFVFGKVLN